jgi:hypothetical protein
VKRRKKKRRKKGKVKRRNRGGRRSVPNLLILDPPLHSIQYVSLWALARARSVNG